MRLKKSFYIKTFGCLQNRADSERVKAFYWNRSFSEVKDWKKADLVIINSCVVRESAENRVYGLIDNIKKFDKKIKIVLTGCLAGLERAKILADKVEILPIKEISYEIKPLREDRETALIPISFGCDNFCSYCIVPYARGREKSRKEAEILKEVDEAIENNFKKVILIGQNVNSYAKGGFAKLLAKVAKRRVEKISFVSSNPWDFSDKLIAVIAKHKNIDRLIHLPLQSGDDEILKKMNRKYSAKQYLALVKKIREKIPEVEFSTDILIGFPGEDKKAFANTIGLCKKIGFKLAYLNKYSPRAGTVSAKLYKDDVSTEEKKRRWKVLDKLINKKLS
ncbi:MiaB/RimO family radical SAM methylthiotransferase [Patescibacteria group bacterium]|nr:MiaB/RimO family radical SAM methylthiotransferase [Patescibacteria group bacterium]